MGLSTFLLSIHNDFMHDKQLRHTVEKYSNHLGAVDNFTQTPVSTGTATTDAANHKMDLVSGNAVGSYAAFMTKTTRVLSTKPLVLNFLVTGLVNGTGANKITNIGLNADFSLIPGGAGYILFTQYPDDVWSIAVKGPLGTSLYLSLSIQNGDMLTIVATTTELFFLVNGVIVLDLTNAAQIPTNAMYVGASVLCMSAAGTSRLASIDMMSLDAYK